MMCFEQQVEVSHFGTAGNNDHSFWQSYTIRVGTWDECQRANESETGIWCSLRSRFTSVSCSGSPGNNIMMLLSARRHHFQTPLPPNRPHLHTQKHASAYSERAALHTSEQQKQKTRALWVARQLITYERPSICTHGCSGSHYDYDGNLTSHYWETAQRSLQTR